VKKSSASVRNENVKADPVRPSDKNAKASSRILVVTGIIAGVVILAACAALVLYFNKPGGEVPSSEPSSDVSSSDTTDLSPVTAASSSSGRVRNSDPSQLKAIDARAPYVLDKRNITLDIAKGQKMGMDVLDGVLSYIDDYDSEPVVTYTGDVNDKVAGTYPITVKITDWAGNAVTLDLKVKVWDSTGYTPPTGETTTEAPPKYYKFKDFVADYGPRGTMVGIDVSKWQGNIDFNKVKAAGCEFVIMRCGVYYEKEFKLDPTFKTNYANAKAAGLKVGIYYASTDATPDEVRDNANKLIDALNGDKLDFPVTFDWENFGHIQRYKISLNDLSNLYDVFEETCKARGYETMLYASKYYLTEIWKPADSVTVWLAQYNKKVTYTGSFYMWQVSDCGKIDGIDGPVDMDILMPEGG
jgi:GH25 family lysozyme M1 (1,4-beta-N-acetylmuramidase)